MDHIVLVSHFNVGKAVLPQGGVGRTCGVAVQHKNLPKMRSGGTQKVEAVCLGLAERLLMAEDDFLVVFFKLAGGNEAPALELRFRRLAGETQLERRGFIAAGQLEENDKKIVFR